MAKRIHLHPMLGQFLLVGLNVGARAAAKAFDSVLTDFAVGLGAAEEKVESARANLRRKVQESERAMGWEESWRASPKQAKKKAKAKPRRGADEEE